MTDSNNTVKPFKLCAELRGHEADVRTVGSYDLIEGAVVTGSRDQTIKVWHPIQDSSPPAYECYKTLTGHTNYVAAVAYMPPLNDEPAGSIVSASHDRNLIIWDVEEGNPKAALTGHDQPVCAVSVAADGKIVSGAWDSTARVWSGENTQHILKGHTQNVLCVLALENGDVITGSADKTIKKWRNGQEVQILCRHNDIIRSLAFLPGIGIVSCSNDGEVRITSLDGQLVQQIMAHDHIIYNICVLPTGEIATASEDKTIKIFKDGKCVQTIPHPGNVWDVKPLPNGDIVTGCSDYVARVWTRSEGRVGGQDLLQGYQDNLATQEVSKKTIGQVDLDKLPGEDALQEKGQNDGQTKLVRHGDSASVYQWSEAESTWIKIGDVVEGPKEGQKTYMDGKLYDYVFDIEIEGPSGVTTLKLPYNKGENPYMAAQKFIWKHELTQDYLEDIANHITNNSEQPPPMPSGGSDPFTGGSRYVPGSSSGPEAPNHQQRPPAHTSQFAVSDYAKEALARQKPAEVDPSKHYPKMEMTVYRQANYSGIQKKLFEFNAKLEDNTETSGFALSEKEQESFTDLIASLQQGTSDIDMSQDQFDAFHRLLQWPTEYVFPAIDLARLLIICPSVSKFYAQDDTFDIVHHLVDLCFGEATSNPLKMLCLRFLANATQTEMRGHILQNFSKILSKTSRSLSAPDKVRTTFVVMMYNFSIVLSKTDQEEHKKEFLETLKQILLSETNNGNLYTELVAIGNLVHNSEVTSRHAKELNFKEILEPRQQRSFGDNVAECAACLGKHLS